MRSRPLTIWSHLSSRLYLAMGTFIKINMHMMLVLCVLHMVAESIIKNCTRCAQNMCMYMCVAESLATQLSWHGGNS